MFGGFGRKPSRAVEQTVDEIMADFKRMASEVSDRPANTPEQLRNAYAVFKERHTFKPGDLVMWKPLHKNRKLPALNEPAIVIEVLATPLRGDRDSGSNVFNEPLDLVLGLIDHEGDFTHWHYDSRRFQPYRDDNAAE